jgi:hypothetical protein|tara:strand:+ start:1330 stop:1578 length:249 start_codon:yes stop_codon:yes gene_type:complete
MPFIEQEASSEYKEIDGKKVHYIKPEVEITLTNKETGQEYMSDKEADDDVDNPATDTKREHIKRDVHVKVAAIKLGADTGKV